MLWVLQSTVPINFMRKKNPTLTMNYFPVFSTPVCITESGTHLFRVDTMN
jgi:hypothetical protein